MTDKQQPEGHNICSLVCSPQCVEFDEYMQEVVCEHSPFVLSYKKKSMLPPGVTQKIRIRCCVPRDDDSPLCDTLVIRSNHGTLNVPLVAYQKKPQALQMNFPKAINFNSVSDVGEEHRKRVYLRNDSGTPYEFFVKIVENGTDFHASPLSGVINANDMTALEFVYAPSRRMTSHGDVHVSVHTGESIVTLSSHLTGSICRARDESATSSTKSSLSSTVSSSKRTPRPRRKQNSGSGGGAIRASPPPNAEKELEVHTSTILDNSDVAFHGDECGENACEFARYISEYKRHEQLLLSNPCKLRIGQKILAPAEIEEVRTSRKIPMLSSDEYHVGGAANVAYIIERSDTTYESPQFDITSFSWSHRNLLVQRWKMAITWVIKRRRLLARLRMLQQACDTSSDDTGLQDRLNSSTLRLPFTSKRIDMSKCNNDILPVDDVPLFVPLHATNYAACTPPQSHLMGYECEGAATQRNPPILDIGIVDVNSMRHNEMEEETKSNDSSFVPLVLESIDFESDNHPTVRVGGMKVLPPTIYDSDYALNLIEIPPHTLMDFTNEPTNTDISPFYEDNGAVPSDGVSRSIRESLSLYDLGCSDFPLDEDTVECVEVPTLDDAIGVFGLAPYAEREHHENTQHSAYEHAMHLYNTTDLPKESMSDELAQLNGLITNPQLKTRALVW